MKAEVLRLRKFEKPPEQLLKDLSEHKDWEEIVVVGTYGRDGKRFIDVWHNQENATTLIGMLMRGILMLHEQINGKD